MTKGVSSVLNQNVLNSFAVAIATSTPRIYNPRKTSAACFSKNVPTSKHIWSSLAEQDMNGLIRMVIILLERLSIDLDDIIAGTLQPKPIISGIKDFPCRPILCMSLSIMNAARAIYPESSIKDIQK